MPRPRERDRRWPGHLDIDRSDDHDQKEPFLEISPRQKEVEEVVHGSDQLSQTKVSSSQPKLTQCGDAVCPRLRAAAVGVAREGRRDGGRRLADSQSFLAQSVLAIE
jgi:hypothetical protein